MRGVGYRAQLQGSKLVLAVGKSHPDEVEAPEELLLNFQAKQQSLLAEFQKVVSQAAAYVRLRSGNHIKVKVYVTLVNSFAVKKVKQLSEGG